MTNTLAVTIDVDRLAQIKALARGSHAKGAAMCVMEAAAYVAREPWSDHPDCVCPVIGRLMRSWNEDLPDADRTKLLLPLIPKTIGTRGSRALAERRATMAADWYLRTFAPAWLRLAGLDKHADVLAGLPEVASVEKLQSIRPAFEATQKGASGKWPRAVWVSWRAAGGLAAVVAAGSVWFAPRVAAKEEQLASATIELQQSAVLLVERMCALTEADLLHAA